MRSWARSARRFSKPRDERLDSETNGLELVVPVCRVVDAGLVFQILALAEPLEEVAEVARPVGECFVPHTYSEGDATHRTVYVVVHDDGARTAAANTVCDPYQQHLVRGNPCALYIDATRTRDVPSH